MKYYNKNINRGLCNYCNKVKQDVEKNKMNESMSTHLQQMVALMLQKGQTERREGDITIRIPSVIPPYIEGGW